MHENKVICPRTLNPYTLKYYIPSFLLERRYIHQAEDSTHWIPAHMCDCRKLLKVHVHKSFITKEWHLPTQTLWYQFALSRRKAGEGNTMLQAESFVRDNQTSFIRSLLKLNDILGNSIPSPH